MYVQLFTILLALIGAWSYSGNPAFTQSDKEYYRRNYIVFLCIILILQSGLRNLAVGPDTYAYYLQFEDVKNRSWEDIWHNFYAVYVDGVGKDAGYPLLQKVFQIFFSNYRVFLFGVATFFFYTFGKFIYTNTSRIQEALVVFCLYQSLFYSFFSITGIRQTIATGFTLWCYQYIQKQKLLPFVILVLIGATIHKSVLIFLPFYFLAQLRKTRILLTGSLILLPVMFNVARRMAVFLANISGSKDYMMYAESDYETTGAKSFIAFLVFVAIAAWWAGRKKRKETSPAINAIAIALIFTPLAWVDPSLMRIVQYFSIFLLLLVPAMISTYFKQPDMRQLVVAGAVVFFTSIVIKHNYDYAFAWQQMALGANY